MCLPVIERPLHVQVLLAWWEASHSGYQNAWANPRHRVLNQLCDEKGCIPDCHSAMKMAEGEDECTSSFQSSFVSLWQKKRVCTVGCAHLQSRGWRCFTWWKQIYYNCHSVMGRHQLNLQEFFEYCGHVVAPSRHRLVRWGHHTITKSGDAL